MRSQDSAGNALSSSVCTGDSICRDIAKVSLLLTDVDLLLALQLLLPSHKLEKMSLKLLPLAIK